MHEDSNAEFLDFRPEWIELRRRRHFAGNMTGDSNAAQAQRLDSFLQLLHGKIGMLQRNGGQSHKAIWMSSAGCRQFLILDLDEPLSEIAVGPVPPGALVAEHLHVNSTLVQVAQTRVVNDQRSRLVGNVTREVRVLDEIEFFASDEVSVDIDDFDAAPSNGDLTPACRCRLRQNQRATKETATCCNGCRCQKE